MNQHSNFSHPKVVVYPRGVPLAEHYAGQAMWDLMREALSAGRKQSLVVAISSTWGSRPQILRCISDKFDPSELDGHQASDTDLGNRTKRVWGRDYLARLAKARFGICMPGIGYDTYRQWEYLMVGTIPVLERGVGFDRTLWRLPALFVDDFSDVNPELLRSAYVEALYHKDDFEFKRLKQSFWWEVISNVSASKSLQPLLDTFPMTAEKPMFTRPMVPYSCWETDSCGPGTMRTPKTYC